MFKVNIGIAGAAGYTAGELIRILMHHPATGMLYLQSDSHRGEKIGSVHTDLIYTPYLFSDIDFSDIDLLFLCMGHGFSSRFLAEHVVPEKVRIIDLGNDFRLSAQAGEFIYGLPELNREKIRAASRIANPGCFATAVELGLLPLAANGLLPDAADVFGITGSTGAGQQPTRETHFSHRNQNLSNYKVFAHQHLDEIKETLYSAGARGGCDLAFVPMRGCHSRGIVVNTVLRTMPPEKELVDLFEHFYASHPFVVVNECSSYLKQVVNTNYCFVSLQKSGNKLLITTMIDNLLKGASGQAVQNMNLMLGLDETCGLQLKASYF